MLAAVSPSAACHGETLHTLRFANLAKNVINTPRVNEVSSKPTMIVSRVIKKGKMRHEISGCELFQTLTQHFKRTLYLDIRTFTLNLDLKENVI